MKKIKILVLILLIMLFMIIPKVSAKYILESSIIAARIRIEVNIQT